MREIESEFVREMDKLWFVNSQSLTMSTVATSSTTPANTQKKLTEAGQSAYSACLTSD